MPRTCGTLDVHRRLLLTDPHYAQERARIENGIWERMKIKKLQRTGVTVIPVVVHVVYNSAEQNISDEQIQSQIDVLNQDFRKRNGDISNVPAPFTGLASDARIQFKLADVDPAGNPVNGITRTKTNKASFSVDDSVKSSAQGGADAWPNDRYLNIWVCELGGGILGYAQFPGGPAATDGVVILHSAFGTTGTAAAPFNLGRTATHEIGHWLNLNHIWGDDDGGCNGTDFVDDTPNQAGPNYGTPGFPHVTCNNGPDGDMFMDFMDYVDDNAMFMFTSGQVARMQATLDIQRRNVGISLAPIHNDARQISVAQNADGRVEVFYIGTNGVLYHNWQTALNNGWSGDYPLGGSAKQLALGRNADGRLEVFYAGTNDGIYHNWQTAPNNGWNGEYPLGGFAKQIAVAQNTDGRLEVFYIGTNDLIYHNWQIAPNGGWSGEQVFGGTAKQITVAHNADGRLEVFYVGTNDMLYHNWQTAPNNGWSGEYALGGFGKQITVAQNSDGRLELVYIGTNDVLYHNWQTAPNNGWSGEYVFGGSAKQITMAQNADGRLEVFYIGTDNAIYHNWQTAPNNGWSGENAFGGWAKQLTVAQNADGRLEVFYIGTNDVMYHNWQTAPNNGWSGENVYRKLGEIIFEEKEVEKRTAARKGKV